jgi:hypothetical protein
MSIADPIPPPEELLHHNVPLPGSVSGRRIVKLEIATQDFRQDVPVPELFTTLGFAKSTGTTWRYDRARALEWFLGELRALRYSWVQDPWRMEAASTSQASEAGPRPTTRPVRDVDRDQPKLPGRKVLER